jgi:hypothetical protein
MQKRNDDTDDGAILPCPWCGKVPIVRRYAVFKTGEIRFGIWCNNGNPSECPMTTVETLPFETRRGAIDAWNRRSNR